MNTAPTLSQRSSGTADSHGGGAKAWTVTGLLVVFMMVNFADKSVLGLAADEIRADLHLSATQFGLANSAFFLLFSLSAVVVGLVADRVSPRLLLLVMALLWSVAQAPAAIGGGLAVLVTSRVVLGAAEGPAFPVAQQATLAWFPNHRRNLPGALITLGVTLGVIVSAPGLSWVIEHHGWRAALWVLAGAGLVWALAWKLFGADGDHRTEEKRALPAADAPAPVPYGRILATRTWIGATLAYFTSYWSVALMLVWLPSYLRNALGHPAHTAAVLIVVPWAIGAVALLAQAGITGRLMRRGVGSRRARGRVGGWLLALGAACLLAQTFVDGSTGKTVLVALGFGLGGSYATVAATTIAELAPAGRSGGSLGAMNAVVTAAGLAAPAVVGALVDAQGNDGYHLAVTLSGVLLVIGAAASFLLIDPARDIARLAR
ncbi:MFS transporter [Streptomyces sp. NPDC050529]|uniref:MFS transporter n=1 Tax=Streptomyces sp. NPDC050529 TaxID=3365624 RepID=UPI0037A7424B